jgi:hypothetical protein
MPSQHVHKISKEVIKSTLKFGGFIVVWDAIVYVSWHKQPKKLPSLFPHNDDAKNAKDRNKI